MTKEEKNEGFVERRGREGNGVVLVVWLIVCVVNERLVWY